MRGCVSTYELSSAFLTSSCSPARTPRPLAICCLQFQAYCTDHGRFGKNGGVAPPPSFCRMSASRVASPDSVLHPELVTRHAKTRAHPTQESRRRMGFHHDLGGLRRVV